MKIKKVLCNNRKKAFEIITSQGLMDFPYSQLNVAKKDKILDVFVDSELGNEAITYRLESGKEESIHIDQILEYNKDTDYLRQVLLYKLTLKAQKLIEAQNIKKRELIRRLNTSPTQFYRLLDQTNTHKTIDQMIRLLTALGCPVDIVFSKAA
jgi:Cro/C1-type HTH DNA-binding domain